MSSIFLAQSRTNFVIMSSVDFLQHIDEEIGKRGWSRNKLTEKAGLASNYFTNISKGRGVGPEGCVKIAKALRLPVTTVYSWAGILKDAPLDPWAEEQYYKLQQLSDGKRALAERLLDALLAEQDKEIQGQQVKVNS